MDENFAAVPSTPVAQPSTRPWSYQEYLATLSEAEFECLQRVMRNFERRQAEHLGEVLGSQNAVEIVLRARFLAPRVETLVRRIHRQTDLKILEVWLNRVAVAESNEEIWATIMNTKPSPLDLMDASPPQP